jgi:NTP pyrophosphatase (non-canonical NTP hydrolase)
MKAENPVFNKLLEAIDSSLSDVQRLFDEYQKNYFTYRPPEFFCLELNGEAGELANLEKKLWKGKAVDKSSLADETADVFIALFNYANSRQIDIKSALINKLRKIEKTRIELAQRNQSY